MPLPIIFGAIGAAIASDVYGSEKRQQATRDIAVPGIIGLSDEDAVRLAILEALCPEMGTDPRKHAVRFVAVDDPGASWLGSKAKEGARDPSGTLQAALDRQYGAGRMRGAFHGDRSDRCCGTFLSVGPVEHIGPGTYEAHGKYYCGRLCGGSSLYRVKIRNGKGHVVGIERGVVS